VIGVERNNNGGRYIPNEFTIIFDDEKYELWAARMMDVGHLEALDFGRQ